MSPYDGMRIVSEGQPDIARDVSAAWLTFIRTRIGQITAFIGARRRRAQQIRDLHGMTDRELRDIGLSRFDVPAIEDGTYRRDQRRPTPQR